MSGAAGNRRIRVVQGDSDLIAAGGGGGPAQPATSTATRVPSMRRAALFRDWPMVDRLTTATAIPAHLGLSQPMARAIP